MGGLLALDLGTALGWAVGPLDGVPLLGTAALPPYGQSEGAYFASYADWLADMITMHQPDEIAGEQTLAARGEMAGIHAAETLLGLRAMTSVVAYRREVRLNWHVVSTVRKTVCGHGHAKKDQVNAEIIRRGCRPDSHNAADAGAVWFHRAEQIAQWQVERRARRPRPSRHLEV